jgi:hypothetical protein
MKNYLPVICSVLLLAACGGGGGGSSGGGTTVGQGVPIITNQPNPKFTDIKISQPGVSVSSASYSSADKSWEIVIDRQTLALSGSNIKSNSTILATRYDTITDGSLTTVLAVNPDEGRFRYITFGVVGDAAGFATGSQTPLSGVPTDLQATYSAEVYGFARVFDPLSDADPVSGVLDLNVNFAEGTVSGQVKDFATNIGNTNLSTVDLYSGQISGSGFTGLARANADPTQEQFFGNFQGAFYGPNAEEVAGSFHLNGNEDGYVDAGFGGTR